MPMFNLSKGFSKMKKILSVICASMGFAVFADGTPVIDTTTASTAVQQIGIDLGFWATTVLPYLLGIVAAFLVFWLVRFSIKLIRSFASSSDVNFTASNGVKFNLGSVSSI